jgi:hypothetical protein
MEPRDADVVDPVYVISHELGGERRFLGNR